MGQPLFFINLANVIFISLITLHEHSECPTTLTSYFFHDFPPASPNECENSISKRNTVTLLCVLSSSALDNHTTQLHTHSINKGCTNFAKMWAQPQDSRCQHVYRKHANT